MKSEGKTPAERYLDEVFSADRRLEDLVGSELTTKQILDAAARQGFEFTEEELIAAIKSKLSERGIQISRFCFSESPCA